MAKIASKDTDNRQGNSFSSRSGSNRPALTENQKAEVTRLSYQFYVERGYQHGHDVEDWLRAEEIVRSRKLS